MKSNKKLIYFTSIVLGYFLSLGALAGNIDLDSVANLNIVVGTTKTEFLVGEPIALELQVANPSTIAFHVLDLRGKYFQITGTDSKGQPLKNRKDVFSKMFYVFSNS